MARLSFWGSSGSVIAAGFVQGTGVGPQVNFLPAAQSTVVSGSTAAGVVAVDAGGNLEISSGGSVLKLTPTAGGYSQSTVGSGSGGGAVDGGGNVYIVNGDSVFKETLSGGSYTQSVVATFPPPPPPIYIPETVAVDGGGNVYISASEGTSPYRSYQVFKETPSAGGYTQSVVVTASTDAFGIAVDGSSNVYISEEVNGYSFGTGEVIKETPTGDGYTQSVIVDRRVDGFGGIAVDGGGNLFLADPYYGYIFEFTPMPDGTYSQNTVASGLISPRSIVVDGSDNVYTTQDGRILKEDSADPPSLSFATIPAGVTGTDSPQTVTLENVGNAPLTFPIPSTGYNPGISTNFTLTSGGTSDCPLLTSGSAETATLAADAACLLTISFTPTTAGTFGGTLALTDTNLNAAAPNYSTQAIQLGGTSAMPTASSLASPAPSSRLTGPSVTFSWTPGTDAAEYQFLLGTTGAGSSDLYNSGSTTSTFAAVTGIPIVGATIYARLSSMINGAWQYSDYTYTEAVPTPAMQSPTPGTATILGASNVTFTWTPGAGDTLYDLWLGTREWALTMCIVSGRITATSVTVPKVPYGLATDTVYVRLWYLIGQTWQSIDYTYSATPSVAPVLTIPTPGSVLGTSNVTFTWTPGTGPTLYDFWLGTKGVGSDNVYVAGHITATSATAPKVPYGLATDTLYVRLWYLIDETWQSIDYTYSETPSVAPVLTTPTPGSVLGTSNVTFTWTPGTGPTLYDFWLSTNGVGTDDLYVSGHITTTSTTAPKVPANGATIYVRLWYLIDNTWHSTDYTYTEQ